MEKMQIQNHSIKITDQDGNQPTIIYSVMHVEQTYILIKNQSWLSWLQNETNHLSQCLVQRTFIETFREFLFVQFNFYFGSRILIHQPKMTTPLTLLKDE